LSQTPSPLQLTQGLISTSGLGAIITIIDAGRTNGGFIPSNWPRPFERGPLSAASTIFIALHVLTFPSHRAKIELSAGPAPPAGFA
jgi:hypothetical protein